MNKLEDLWLEVRFRARVYALCEQLGWKYAADGWDCFVWPEERDARIRAAPRRVGNMPYVEFRYAPYVGFYPNGPFASEVLEFILRRNADLASLHWCISRFDGIAVVAARPLDSLTADELRDTVMRLLQERNDFQALVDQECQRTTTANNSPLVGG